jgi:hypothetical protein
MLAKPIASYYTSQSPLVAKTVPPQNTTSSIIQQCRGLAQTMPEVKSGNIPLGTSGSAKRVSFHENVGRSKPQETGLNKTSQQATIDPSNPVPIEKPLQRHPRAPETHSSVRSKRIRPEGPDSSEQTAKKTEHASYGTPEHSFSAAARRDCPRTQARMHPAFQQRHYENADP